MDQFSSTVRIWSADDLPPRSIEAHPIPRIQEAFACLIQTTGDLPVLGIIRKYVTTGTNARIAIHKRHSDAEPKEMTREEFGAAYEQGRERTIRFLLARGAAPALVPDIAQSAWLTGWEKLDQLRDPRLILPWVNSIALNHYRRAIRIECLHQEIQESDHGTTTLNLAAIDVNRVLRSCRPADRHLLEAQMKGVTPKELARQKGLKSSTVRIRLLRARRSARMVLETPAVDLQQPIHFETSRAAVAAA